MKNLIQSQSCTWFSCDPFHTFQQSLIDPRTSKLLDEFVVIDALVGRARHVPRVDGIFSLLISGGAILGQAELLFQLLLRNFRHFELELVNYFIKEFKNETMKR